MGLYWNWDQKIGTLTVHDVRQDKDFDISLYEGNAYLIALSEYTDRETGEDMYNMYTFFADKTHAKRCLGLDKKWNTYGENMFEDGVTPWKKIRLSKKYSHLKELVGFLVEAFDDLEIEIYTEKE